MSSGVPPGGSGREVGFGTTTTPCTPIPGLFSASPQQAGVVAQCRAREIAEESFGGHVGQEVLVIDAGPTD